MKALHVIDRYFPSINGSELYFQELSERLAREGHQVQVYTTNAWDLEYFWSKDKRAIEPCAETHNGVSIRRFPVEWLPAAPLAYPVLRRAMAQLARLPMNTVPLLFALGRWTPRVPALERALEALDEHFDLVHAVNIPLDSIMYAAYRFARRRKLPFVATPFIHFGEPGDSSVSRFYTMPHQIEMLRGAEAVIVQTRLEAEALAEHGVPRAKMHCVGMGVNPDELRGGDGARFRAQYGIDGPLVFFIGTPAFDKGTMHLVEAMERLWPRVDATLVIAGPPLAQFKNFFEKRPAETKRRTRLIDFVGLEAKRDLLAAGDVLVMPSRTDSFGIVYLEAWLYNKPVIGARAGGVPAVIDDGRDGFLVKFGDVDALAARIEQLLTDRALARNFGAAGCAKVLQGFTWDKKYAQLRIIYGQLAS